MTKILPVQRRSYARTECHIRQEGRRTTARMGLPSTWSSYSARLSSANSRLTQLLAVTTYQDGPLQVLLSLRHRTSGANDVVESGIRSAIHRAVEYHFNELFAGNKLPSSEVLLGEYARHWRETDSATVRFGKGEKFDGLGEFAGRVIVALQTSSLTPRGGYSSVPHLLKSNRDQLRGIEFGDLLCL